MNPGFCWSGVWVSFGKPPGALGSVTSHVPGFPSSLALLLSRVHGVYSSQLTDRVRAPPSIAPSSYLVPHAPFFLGDCGVFQEL